jgi:translation initiation factor IF-1
MSCGDRLEITGVVSEQLPNAMFRVILNDSRRSSVTVHVPPQSSFLRIRPGDEVVVELSPYDTARGRILRKVSQ